MTDIPSGYTPGPWNAVQKEENDRYTIVNEAGATMMRGGYAPGAKFIADVRGPLWPGVPQGSENDATARLIALAPEMADEIVRLRAEVESLTKECGMGMLEIANCRSEIDRLRAEVERKDAALRAICEGDIPRPVAKPYRADGTPSKNDQCEHGQWMYEECGQCIEQFARAALTAQEKADGK